MCRSIVLAYDGSRESQLALREGAILARRLGADVQLLSVVNEGSGVMIAESVYPGSVQAMEQTYRDILDEDAERLRAPGLLLHGRARGGRTSGDDRRLRPKGRRRPGRRRVIARAAWSSGSGTAAPALSSRSSRLQPAHGQARHGRCMTAECPDAATAGA